MALGQGNKFGVVAIAEPSIERHIKSIRRMGVIDRLSSERALNITVDETARGLKTFEMLVKVGNELLEDGADVIILGCAGMATHRSKLEKELGKPVVDPTQAAVSMALGNILIS
jgi:Asp/Glu/hydantoin racemase